MGVILSWMAAVVLGLVSLPFSWIPLVGLLISLVVNAINGGILVGTLAGLWRERRAANGWATGI